MRLAFFYGKPGELVEKFFCHCREKDPQVYDCPYGGCRITRCSRCGKIISLVRVGECHLHHSAREG
jgi:hypothetical protein